MGTILDKLAEYSSFRVQEEKKLHSLEELKEKCADAGKSMENKFEAALRKNGVSFICEVKKASPSKGIISEDFPYLDIAREYEKAGADCISCLTEPKWFLGSDEIFREIRREVKIPMLRKDFTVDEYQIYQAKLMGADAVLLICAILDTAAVERYLGICGELGLAAVVETHSEEEIKTAVSAGAKIIGVNNRNLKDFSVDVGNSGRLRSLVPENIVFVAESGIKTPEDIEKLRREKVDAVLVGETLMRAADKKKALDELRGINEKN